MRRLAALAAGLVLLLVACGGGKPARLTPADVLGHAAPGDVQISFCLGSSMHGCTGAATAAEEHAVEKRVTHASCVNQVVFVSQEDSLRYLQKKDPAIGTGPAGMPSVPDEVTVVPSKSSCGSSIAAGLKRAHLRGVEEIQVTRAAHG